MLNRRFGKLVVLEKIRPHPTAKRDAIYRCICDCGNICEARMKALQKGHKKSCGCLLAEATASPWVGKKVGQLLVLEKIQGRRYRCLCDCGREIISTSMWSRAKTPNAHCRGPAHNKVSADSPPKVVQPRQRDHWAYGVWAAMKQRCANTNSPEYRRYGGRGIVVCEEWADNFWAYAAFVDALPGRQPGYSLDRVDNDGHYEPGNLRWASPQTQVENSRQAKPKRYGGILYPTAAVAYRAWVADGRPKSREFTEAAIARAERALIIEAEKKAAAAARSAEVLRRRQYRAEYSKALRMVEDVPAWVLAQEADMVGVSSIDLVDWQALLIRAGERMGGRLAEPVINQAWRVMAHVRKHPAGHWEERRENGLRIRLVRVP